MSGNENEFELLRRFADGDEDAFTDVLTRWEKPLINFVYHMIPERTEAEDIAQEVFLKVAAADAGLRQQAKFSTYLYRIAYNLTVDRLRRSKVRTAAVSIVSLDETAESDSGESLSRQVPDPSDLPAALLRERLETKRSVEAALAGMPGNQRAAITLKVYEDRSYAEIAGMLDVSVPEGCLLRMRPVLMTAIITVASLTPMLFAAGPGSEAQRPLAVVVIGGLPTSTVLTLLVLPALYACFSRRET